MAIQFTQLRKPEIERYQDANGKLKLIEEELGHVMSFNIKTSEVQSNR